MLTVLATSTEPLMKVITSHFLYITGIAYIVVCNHHATIDMISWEVIELLGLSREFFKSTHGSRLVRSDLHR